MLPGALPILAKRRRIGVILERGRDLKCILHPFHDGNIIPGGKCEWIVDSPPHRVDRSCGAHPDPDDAFRFRLSLDLLDQTLDFFQPGFRSAARFDRRLTNDEQIAVYVKRTGTDDCPAQIDSYNDPVHQPFTAPAVKPLTIYRWSMSASSTGGMAASTPPV